MVFSNNLLMGAAGQATGYEIDQSIRFNRNDDAKLTRTFGTATNRRKFTLSVWQKNGSSAGSMLEYNATGGVTWANITIGAGGRVDIFDYSSGSARIDLRTTAVFRDPAAWVHLVVAFDTTQGTAADRIKVYINGTQVTSFGTATYPSQDFDGFLNSAVEHLIGEGVNGPFDGYIAEYYFIDGQQLGPDSFGETNDDGVWIPKNAASLTFGNNGFYLKGQDSSALGDDSSGNGNDFTSSGLAAADQMSDSPTNNHCTYNPLRIRGTNTLSDGNLQAAAGSAGAYVTSTFGVSSGKWYWEYTFTGTYNFPIVGIMGTALYQDAYPSQLTNAVLYYSSNGNKYIDSTSSSYGASYAVSDKIGVALNLDDNEITFFKNNSTQGAISISNREYTPLAGEEGSVNGGIIANFGQSDFEYTPPTGFKALNTSNLPTPTISDGSKYFDTKLWTGNDTDGRAITGYNFSPDWVWIKSRSGAYSHNITDTVRGVGNYIQSNTSDAEVDGPGAFGSTLAFTSDGYTLDNGTSDNLYVNAGGETYVGWGWDANGSGSSNTDGSINTTATSANTTAGFSISTYTGTGANATVGHGLGVAPSFVIIKSRNDTHDWYVRTPALSGTEFILLNSNAVKGTSSPEVWNSTAPTSSIVNIGTSIGVNRSTYNYVMYCFAEIPGFSSVGSYVGNGAADGPYVSCDFAPAWVMGKRIAGSGGHFDWWLFDSKRPGFNVTNARIHPNNNQATDTGAGSLDLVSNGFKIRTSTSSMNNSGDTFLYMAFAENPFGGDGIAPATAR